MSEFTLHTLETAPLESRPFLQQAKNQLGFIPNLYAALAESPAILETNQVLTALFNKTAFTVTERQLILLSISRVRNCSYCLAAHGSVAKMQKIPTHLPYPKGTQGFRCECAKTATLHSAEQTPVFRAFGVEAAAGPDDLTVGGVMGRQTNASPNQQGLGAFM